jgi:hypothetical protein
MTIVVQEMEALGVKYGGRETPNGTSGMINRGNAIKRKSGLVCLFPKIFLIACTEGQTEWRALANV